jgi:hypothetical protein
MKQPRQQSAETRPYGNLIESKRSSSTRPVQRVTTHATHRGGDETHAYDDSNAPETSQIAGSEEQGLDVDGIT